MGGPSASVRFQSRAHNGLFPAEPIAVPRSLLNIEFVALLPKLLAEFWPAVRDDVEGVPEAMPEDVEAVTFTVNEKRAPKNGSLSEIVDDDEELDIVVFIKGADDYTFWIAEDKIKRIGNRGESQSATKKRKIEQQGDETEHTRRKIKRWEVDETKLLVELVTELGKGKWKRVLERGAGTFDKHRTTVDLKDKWRNLERAGIAPILPDNNDTKRSVRRKKKPEEMPASVPNSIPIQSANIQAMAAEVKAGNLAPDQLVASLVGSQMGTGPYSGSMPTNQTPVNGALAAGVPVGMQLPVLSMDPSHLPPSNPPILQAEAMPQHVTVSAAAPGGGVPMMASLPEVGKNQGVPQPVMTAGKHEQLGGGSAMADGSAPEQAQKDDKLRGARARTKTGKEQ